MGHKIQHFFFFILLVVLSSTSYASNDVKTLMVNDETEVDIRIFKADGDALLIGFACDQGASFAEELTAKSLAKDGLEVWMPDMLSAYMLPKVRSSLDEIETSSLLAIVEEAKKTNKKIYLVASGADTELILRLAQKWQATHNGDVLAGAVLMFPRLNKSKPEPGKAPEYKNAVGKTKIPIMLLEGERTPNRWGVGHLTHALKQGGSTVYAKLIPDVRGFFFKRKDSNTPETLVTTQMAGLIKASIFYLGRAHHEKLN